jgi:nucleoside-diphosphate-sugar epimerase
MFLLVTGSTGFIGSYFCKKETQLELSKLDSNVRINSSCGSNPFLQKELNNSSVVLHLAGLAHRKYTEQELDEVNHLGTLELALAAVKAGVKRFVFVSSIGVNGKLTNGKSFDEVDMAVPHNSFTESKWQAEQGLLAIAKESGMEVVIIRPVLVYGANASGNFGLLTKLVKKLPFLPFTLVNNKRSFISIDNLCDFISVCITHPKAANQTFVIADGEPVSTKVFTNAMAKGLRKKVTQLPIPVWIMSVVAKLCGKSSQSQQLLGDLEVDCSKARDLLGWTPSETMRQAMGKLI